MKKKLLTGLVLVLILAALAAAGAEGTKNNGIDYIGVAVAAVKEKYPDLDPLDEAAYRIYETGMKSRLVEFLPKDIDHGMISVSITPEGKVSAMEVDAELLDADNLFRRYRNVYGYYAAWDQELWIDMERTAAGLPEPQTAEGKTLKATHYPEENSVKISREEAKKLALLASEGIGVEAHTCVLVDAKPHPVWILRVLQYVMDDDPVFGIDAETGETLFTEWYVVDETPWYVMAALPETWQKAEGVYEEPAPAPLADGKPWCWGMDFAPVEYWERAEAFLTAEGITAGNFDLRQRKWDAEAGGYDFQSQEHQAAGTLFRITEKDLEDPEFDYLPFPDPEKKSQKEIEETARDAVRALAEGKEADWADGLKADSTLYNDSRNPDREGENYGKHVWWVWFYSWSEENEWWSAMEGYAILDEDGNVLTAGLGEI